MSTYYQYYGIALAILIVKIALCTCICLARSAKKQQNVQRYGLPESGLVILRNPVDSLRGPQYNRLESITDEARNDFACEQESCPPPAYDDTQHIVTNKSHELTS